MIVIDGSFGEGGGQILRTALSLAMITGEPFRIEKIRGRRRRSGLMRQHLTCVRAAEAISGAKVDGAALGSTALTFRPGSVKAGDYRFAIPTAGATSLVFQTVLPALALANAPSSVHLTGGTHVPMAPTYDYLELAFLPLLARMGVVVETRLKRRGFYPAGGGEWQADIAPADGFGPLVVEERGDITVRRIIADVANIPYDVAEREASSLASQLSWPAECAKARTVKSDGPGNVLMAIVEARCVSEVFCGFGDLGIAAETLVTNVAASVRDYLVAGAPVGGHLADQLLLPMALAGSGAFVTVEPSQHTRTHVEVIEKFLPVEFALAPLDERRWRVEVTS